MIADDKTGKAGQKIDGYTPEQRFFLGFGRVWCEKRRPEFSSACWSRSIRTRPGRYPREWSRAEHAGVSKGVGMQGGAADGGTERLPRLVRGIGFQLLAISSQHQPKPARRAPDGGA